MNIVWVSSFSILKAHLTNITNAHSMCYNDVLGGVNTSFPPLAAEPSCLTLQPFLPVCDVSSKDSFLLHHRRSQELASLSVFKYIHFSEFITWVDLCHDYDRVPLMVKSRNLKLFILTTSAPLM